ncbi:MAG: CPBP family intramembrane metalloprotease [Thermoplasmata archaeon]|nr:CPBP family intramembrane metalloprotease [Thermoplasmata archaeon]
MFAEASVERLPAGVGRLGNLPAYIVATAVTVLAILSQYFLPQSVPALRPVYENFAGSLFVIYGIPILAFLLLVGARPLDRFARGTRSALLPSIAWFGALSLLGIGVLIVLILVYLALDPSALNLLEKQNPVLTSAASDPWFWIGFSFVIGAVEEAIFRGWVFGYWIARGSPNLGWHAVWTSALFAGLHLYYGSTYLTAAPLVYTQLFLLGLAFALAVRASRGNLIWVALLHGANDAISFSSILSVGWADALHYGLVIGGAVLAIVWYVRSRPAPSVPPPFVMPPLGGGWEPPVWGAGPPGAPTAVTVIPPPGRPPPPPSPPPAPPPSG